MTIVAVVAVGVGVAFFGLAVLLRTPARGGFLFAVGVPVALVPEGLLPTVTLSLARAASSMAERNALVRRLDAVETLGATTFVCTDKTGTLTRNQMSVVAVWTPQGVIEIPGTGCQPQPLTDDGSPAWDAVRRLARSELLASTPRCLRWCGAGRSTRSGAGCPRPLRTPCTSRGRWSRCSRPASTPRTGRCPRQPRWRLAGGGGRDRSHPARPGRVRGPAA